MTYRGAVLQLAFR